MALLGGVDSRDRPAHGRPPAAHEDEIYFANRRARRAASSYGTAFMGACGGRALWNSAAERREAEGSEVAMADRKLPLFEQPGHGTRVCPTLFQRPHLSSLLAQTGYIDRFCAWGAANLTTALLPLSLHVVVSYLEAEATRRIARSVRSAQRQGRAMTTSIASARSESDGDDLCSSSDDAEE